MLLPKILLVSAFLTLIALFLGTLSWLDNDNNNDENSDLIVL
jgi:hypothetical protein